MEEYRMSHIIFTLNGDYISFVKWDTKFEYNEILRDFGIILISGYSEPVKVMDNYKCQWSCSCKNDIDLDELKDKLNNNIRDLLKTHPELNEFTLDKIDIF